MVMNGMLMGHLHTPKLMERRMGSFTCNSPRVNRRGPGSRHLSKMWDISNSEPVTFCKNSHGKSVIALDFGVWLWQ